jgi:hypothetical protein
MSIVQRFSGLLFVCLLVRPAVIHAAEPVWLRPGGTRVEAVKKALGEDVAAHWIYEDLEAARREAERTGKPLLVLFRCVPCDCASLLDEQVAQPRSASEQLQQKFVCVRVVQMTGVNLQQFQFDQDLSFAVVFLNSDGTVYGRYGTRALADRKSLSHMSHASFQRALERAWAMHQLYPANREELAGKQGHQVADRFAEDLPQMRSFGAAGATKDCIHCHMIGEANLRQRRLDNRVSLQDIWPYPLPETIGLKLETDDGLRVKTARAGSPAAQAGLREGDELVRMNGQPLISQSDVQWVLHDLPVKTEVKAEFRRGDVMQKATIQLAGDWRRIENTWRPTLAGIRPQVELRVGSRQGIAPGDMALAVTYPRGPAAQAGLRNGDLVTAVDGNKSFVLEGDFLRYLYVNEPRPRQVRLSLLRKSEPLEITLPIHADQP